jgi:nucleotide-binding universal stress UspA family protein
MKILIGVDDSEHSRAAVDWVKSASWPRGTKVFVAAAVSVPVMVTTEIYAPGPGMSTQAFEEAVRMGEELTARTEKDLGSHGLDTEARVLHGDPRESLVNYAGAIGADLIVVGSHGRSGLAKLILGSVASHVVSHAPCSVLVVKQKGYTNG